MAKKKERGAKKSKKTAKSILSETLVNSSYRYGRKNKSASAVGQRRAKKNTDVAITPWDI